RPTAHIFLVFTAACRAHRALPSFPTRRSSDLDDSLAPAPGAVADPRAHRGLDRATGRTSRPFEHPRQPYEPWCSIRLVTCRWPADRKSTRLNSSHVKISYAVFCLKKKKSTTHM